MKLISNTGETGHVEEGCRSILFVCTGNYYRSRFAEALFNHQAAQRKLNWRAFSRGLAIHVVPEGDLSQHTRHALEMRGIDLGHTGPTRVQIAQEDFEGATRVIAMDDAEHRPMIRRMFPDWETRILFWKVRDLPWWEPEMGLETIENEVLSLAESLAPRHRHCA